MSVHSIFFFGLCLFRKLNKSAFDHSSNILQKRRPGEKDLLDVRSGSDREMPRHPHCRHHGFLAVNPASVFPVLHYSFLLNGSYITLFIMAIYLSTQRRELVINKRGITTKYIPFCLLRGTHVYPSTLVRSERVKVGPGTCQRRDMTRETQNTECYFRFRISRDSLVYLIGQASS